MWLALHIAVECFFFTMNLILVFINELSWGNAGG
jgi:hypothetical protein